MCLDWFGYMMYIRSTATTYKCHERKLYKIICTTRVFVFFCEKNKINMLYNFFNFFLFQHPNESKPITPVQVKVIGTGTPGTFPSTLPTTTNLFQNFDFYKEVEIA